MSEEFPHHNWTPGSHGKGIVYNDELHTWNTEGYRGDPHHADYIDDLGDERPSMGDNLAFFISPSGTYAVPNYWIDPQWTNTSVDPGSIRHGHELAQAAGLVPSGGSTEAINPSAGWQFPADEYENDFKFSSDSDWGEDSDSGLQEEPDHYPINRVLEDSNADWSAAPGQPFVFDRGTKTIHLAPEGVFHAQIHAEVPNLKGPTVHGYTTPTGGVNFYHATWPEERAGIANSLSEHLGQDLRPNKDYEPIENGFEVGPEGLKTALNKYCPDCQYPIEDCRCEHNWGDGADWATDPVPGASIEEMKPGIRA